MPYLSSTRRAFPKTISTRFLFDHFLNVLIDFCFVSDSVMAAEVIIIIEDYLKSFRPASVDPERLFSLCRFSKNYLQCRLTAEHHSRNVFINKNERFLG